METEELRDVLGSVRAGDRQARDRLFALLYDDLLRRARFELARAGRASLNTTAVVHEAYLKLGGSSTLEPEDRTHFLRIAARAMRSVMVDRARKRLAAKRGGGSQVLSIEDVQVGSGGDGAAGLVALDEALSRLEEKDARLAQVVQLRYFIGQSTEEIADALGVSPRTVKRDWRLARAFLHSELADHPATQEKP